MNPDMSYFQSSNYASTAGSAPEPPQEVDRTPGKGIMFDGTEYFTDKELDDAMRIKREKAKLSG